MDNSRNNWDTILGHVDPSIHGGWVINPETTFPLTLQGVDMETATWVRNQFIAHIENGLHTPDDDGEIVAKTGLICKEISDYVDKYQDFYDDAFDKAAREAERDGETIDDIFEFPEDIDVVPYGNVHALFQGNPIPRKDARVLMERHGIANLRFYVKNHKMLAKPRPIPQSHRDRARFNSLVESGLAVRGPVATKRGKTGEEHRLLEIPNTDLQSLRMWIDWNDAVGEIVRHTFVNAANDQLAQSGDSNAATQEMLRGYEIAVVGDTCTCTFCGKLDGKKYPAGNCPRPPFHLGCRCSLIAVFD